MTGTSAATAAPPSAKNIIRKMPSRMLALPRSEETTTIMPNTIAKCPAICTTDIKEFISLYSFR